MSRPQRTLRLLSGEDPSCEAGGVNCDGFVDSGDAILLLNYPFKGGEAPFPYPAPDVNSDEVVDISDVVYLLNHLFKGGSPPDCR